jgi:DNA-binding response OmpR family regulator
MNQATLSVERAAARLVAQNRRLDAQVGGMNVNILLVEDDELIRFTVAEFMRERGHTVAVAADAEAAMEILRRSQTDVLVADVGLPGMSGDVFAAEARAVQPSLRIVFATGLDRIPDSGENTGPVLLRKPYDADALEAAINAAR